jgi:hypothetical protein
LFGKDWVLMLRCREFAREDGGIKRKLKKKALVYYSLRRDRRLSLALESLSAPPAKGHHKILAD